MSEMNEKHLDETSWAELSSGSAEAGTKRHLAECGPCRDEVARWQNEMQQAAVRMRAQAERDEMFWARQRATIRARAARSLRTMWLRYASTALAALLLVAVLLFSQTPKPKPATGDAVSDEALLEQVESDLNRDAPQALLAAALTSEQE